MKRLFWSAAIAAALALPSAMAQQTTPEGYSLQQVVIVSRHGIRAPLANNGSALAQATAKPWPTWKVAGGGGEGGGGVGGDFFSPPEGRREGHEKRVSN